MDDWVYFGILKSSIAVTKIWLIIRVIFSKLDYIVRYLILYFVEYPVVKILHFAWLLVSRMDFP